MAKKIIAITLAVIIAMSTFITVFAAGTPTITVSSATAEPGETVKLNVSLSNNPGINTFTLGFDYDTSRLKLINVELASGIGGQFAYYNKAVWLNNKNITTNGNYLVLTFRVLSGATEGKTDVTVLYNRGEISNYNEEEVIFDVIPGKITIGSDAQVCSHYGGTSTCTQKAICSACGKEYGTLKDHVYSNVVVIRDASCTSAGLISYNCVCGDSKTENIEATGHRDDNHNGKCDTCQFDFTDGCACNCHKGGIAGLFFKIILFFQKLFGSNKICNCGVYHY